MQWGIAYNGTKGERKAGYEWEGLIVMRVLIWYISFSIVL